MAINPSLLIVPYRYKAAKLYSQLPESGDGDFTVVRGTTATRVNASGLIESVASGVPRLDYTGGGCPALLVEPAATNLVLYSEGFDDSSWPKVSVGTALAPIVTANASVAPDGTTTADRVVFNTVGTSITDRSILRQSQSPGSLRVGSIFLKSNTGLNQTMSFHDGVLVGVITVTNEWQRFNVSIASDKGFFGLETRGNTNPGIRDVLVWGAQLETGSVATSYIPTVASTVTRNADVISLSSASGLIGQSEGTLYTEVNLRAQSYNNFKGVLYVGVDGNNFAEIGLQANGALYARVIAVGVGTSYSSPFDSGKAKIAIAYSQSTLAVALNGTIVLSESISSFSFASPLDKVELGTRIQGGAARVMNDRISAAAIYTSRLSNSELASLTTL